MATNVTAKVSEAIDSATKYVAKAPTANLARFYEFVKVSVGWKSGGGEKSAEARKAYDRGFEEGLRTTGLYSRYQDAGRNGTLDAILASGRKAPSAPKPGPKVETPENVTA